MRHADHRHPERSRHQGGSAAALVLGRGGVGVGWGRGGVRQEGRVLMAKAVGVEGGLQPCTGSGGVGVQGLVRIQVKSASRGLT